MNKNPRLRAAMRRLDLSVGGKFRDLSSEDRETIKASLIDYVSKGIDDGYNLALIRQIGGETDLRVLKLMLDENNKEDR